MSLILNPTGKPIRNDAGGSGFFQAPRGDKLHRDIDFLCSHGQRILAPITGNIVRHSYPYADSKTFSGLVIEGDYCGIQMFYVSPAPGIIGQHVRQGQVIGSAQNIKAKYPDCENHIHFRLLWLDPTILIGG